MTTKLGETLSQWMEGQTTEEEDAQLKHMTPNILFKILQREGYIAK